MDTPRKKNSSKARRRPPVDEDDDDDRPARRRSRNGGNGRVIALAIGVGLLIVVAIVLVVTLKGKGRSKSDLEAEAVLSSPGSANYRPGVRTWTRHEVPGIYRVQFPPGREFIGEKIKLLPDHISQESRQFENSKASFIVDHIRYPAGATPSERGRLYGQWSMVSFNKKHEVSRRNVSMGGQTWNEFRYADEYGARKIHRYLDTDDFALLVQVYYSSEQPPDEAEPFFQSFELLKK